MWFFSVGCFVFNVVGFCVVVMLPWIGGVSVQGGMDGLAQGATRCTWHADAGR